MSSTLHHTVKCNCTFENSAKTAPDTRPRGGPANPNRNRTTSLLTTTTLIYATGAGITAAAGTRLALQLTLKMGFAALSFQVQDNGCLVLLFLVTTSLSQDWAICAPAAFLRCGSHFSGSLSGVKPSSSVTCYCHGRPLPCRRKLIGQKLPEFVIS